jgi:hypothetical protein
MVEIPELLNCGVRIGSGVSISIRTSLKRSQNSSNDL